MKNIVLTLNECGSFPRLHLLTTYCDFFLNWGQNNSDINDQVWFVKTSKSP